MVHRRWASFVTSFVAIDERIVYLDFKKGHVTFRVVAHYFPHGGYSDGHVHQMYSTLSQAHAECSGLKLGIIFVWDFNAVIGSRTDTDGNCGVELFSVGQAHCRGEWLKQWTTLEA